MQKNDIWALGVLTYFFLSGELPSNLDRMQMLKYRFKASDQAIDFISSLCKVDTETRITAKEALQHPWFN